MTQKNGRNLHSEILNAVNDQTIIRRSCVRTASWVYLVLRMESLGCQTPIGWDQRNLDPQKKTTDMKETNGLYPCCLQNFVQLTKNNPSTTFDFVVQTNCAHQKNQDTQISFLKLMNVWGKRISWSAVQTRWARLSQLHHHTYEMGIPFQMLQETNHPSKIASFQLSRRCFPNTFRCPRFFATLKQTGHSLKAFLKHICMFVPRFKREKQELLATR